MKTDRVVGVDLARGLALLGMFVAHLGTGQVDGVWPRDWMWIADGRASALFATLAGVSLWLMTGRVASGDLTGRRRTRIAIVTRAAAIGVLGYLLALLNTPVYVILPAYAIVFMLATPVLWARSRLLVAWAVGTILVVTPAVLWLRYAITGQVTTIRRWSRIPLLGELLTGHYPALIWIVYTLVGILVARWALTSLRRQWALVALGVTLAATGYVGGSALSGASPDEPVGWPGALTSIEPHSSSSFETLGNVGVAVAVIALCLLVCRVRALSVLLRPVAWAGAMTLTLYTSQILVIALLGPGSVSPSSNVPLLVLTLASLTFATVWGTLLGRGPLEKVLHRVAGPRWHAPDHLPGPPARG